jgi:DNA polymerase-3 subunit delta'
MGSAAGRVAHGEDAAGPTVSRLADLVGQSRAVSVLRSAIRRDRVAHAYLFCGPEGVGKSTAARLFAQALNCERVGEEADACGECRACLLAVRGNHPDVRLLTTARPDQSSVIPIETMREGLVYDAYLKPVMGRHKVYIVDPADRAAHQAIHTVLKVLEEPPPRVVIILVTARPGLLPETVPSRCQTIAFQLAGGAAIRRRLMAAGVTPAGAGALALLSGGRIAWALAAAQRPEVLAGRQALLDLCASTERYSVAASLRLAERVRNESVKLALAAAERERARAEGRQGAGEEEQEEGEEVRGVSDRALRTELPWCLDVLASWYRDRFAAASGAAVVNTDYQASLTRALTPDAAHHAETAVEAILATSWELQRNANVDLALESLAVQLLSGSGG